MEAQIQKLKKSGGHIVAAVAAEAFLSASASANAAAAAAAGGKQAEALSAKLASVMGNSCDNANGPEL